MTPEHSWVGRLFRVLMLMLGILTAPSVGVQALQRTHCTQHGTMTEMMSLFRTPTGQN